MSRAEPLYRQIAADLRQRIEDGELPPDKRPPGALSHGAQLPSEVELRDEYGQDGRVVSLNTVRDAIDLLVSRGLVETRPGQGTFVLRKMVPFVTTISLDPRAWGEDQFFKSDAERQGRTPDATRPRVEADLPSDLVARQLELGEGAQVILRHQERRIDGTPWSMQTTFYPMELLQRGPAAARLLMAEGIEGGVIAYLNKHLGINQVRFRDAIIARPSDANERAFFELPDKVQVAIIEHQRTGYDEDGRPMRFTVTVYPADRNQLELSAGRAPRRTE
jgi:GntR family transcriptional regulator